MATGCLRSTLPVASPVPRVVGLPSPKPRGRVKASTPACWACLSLGGSLTGPCCPSSTSGSKRAVLGRAALCVVPVCILKKAWMSAHSVTEFRFGVRSGLDQNWATCYAFNSSACWEVASGMRGRLRLLEAQATGSARLSPEGAQQTCLGCL